MNANHLIYFLGIIIAFSSCSATRGLKDDQNLYSGSKIKIESTTEKVSKNKRNDYQDELEATTKAGLLDSPAILFGDIMPVLTQYPIFTTKTAGGKMLVTENPAYIRKDLPKYIPQFIVYGLNNGPVYYIDQSLNPYKLIDDNFPIEKLQAMIDK